MAEFGMDGLQQKETMAQVRGTLHTGRQLWRILQGHPLPCQNEAANPIEKTKRESGSWIDSSIRHVCSPVVCSGACAPPAVGGHEDDLLRQQSQPRGAERHR